jgi:hypothetical protein
VVHLLVLPLPLLPIFITHCIPAFVVFFPSLLVALLCLLLMYGINFLLIGAGRAFGEGSVLAEATALVAARVISTVVVVVLFSTFSVYAANMYERGVSPSEWASIVSREFENRSYLCMGTALTNQIVAGYLNAIGWVIT